MQNHMISTYISQYIRFECKCAGLAAYGVFGDFHVFDGRLGLFEVWRIGYSIINWHVIIGPPVKLCPRCGSTLTLDLCERRCGFVESGLTGAHIYCG